MKLEEVYKNIDEFANNERSLLGRGGANDVAEGVQRVTVEEAPPDIYRDKQNHAYESSKKCDKHGASRAAVNAAEAVAEQLEPVYHQYKGGYDHLMSMGERGRADQVRHQYLMENFLPAVESVIARTSPDDLLNSQEALAILNRYAGTLVPKGYVEGYVRTAYGNVMGRYSNMSDDMVRHKLSKILSLSEQGLARAAYDKAKELKQRIDNGDALASDADYEIISRVALP